MGPGDPVHVAGFGRGVVRELRNGGRIVVEVKGLSMVVQAAQVTPLEERRRRSRSAGDSSVEETGSPTDRRPLPASIDLHGMTVDEALAALDLFLSDAILAGLPEVQVIHGRSGGRLRTAVHQRLRRLAAIRSFRLEADNQGVTVVTF